MNTALPKVNIFPYVGSYVFIPSSKTIYTTETKFLASVNVGITILGTELEKQIFSKLKYFIFCKLLLKKPEDKQ